MKEFIALSRSVCRKSRHSSGLTDDHETGTGISQLMDQDGGGGP
jgi:hypothetical protein